MLLRSLFGLFCMGPRRPFTMSPVFSVFLRGHFLVEHQRQARDGTLLVSVGRRSKVKRYSEYIVLG